MRHYDFKELNIKNFKEAKVEVSGGSRPRIILKHKSNNQQFFLKTYRHSTREIWAEMFASKLGEAAQFNIQAVSLKKFPAQAEMIFRDKFGDYLPDSWIPVGALVRHAFPKGCEILYGAQIVGTDKDPVTLEEAEKGIRDRYLDSEDILCSIADMIIFDAWIGNMDRHHENWAISHQNNIVAQLSLLRPTKQERERLKKGRGLTPLFDHGSSLLFELEEKKIDRYYNNRDLFEKSYIRGKKYGFILSTDRQKKNIFDILSDHAQQGTKWSKRFKKAFSKIDKVDDLTIARMILLMPTDGELKYGQKRKELLYYSLRRRKEIMKNIF
ncbi:hypothetical protein QTN79_01260 [Candidatus Saccharibacteria bacterium oral taxon 488]